MRGIVWVILSTDLWYLKTASHLKTRLLLIAKMKLLNLMNAFNLALATSPMMFRITDNQTGVCISADLNYDEEHVIFRPLEFPTEFHSQQNCIINTFKYNAEKGTIQGDSIYSVEAPENHSERFWTVKQAEYLPELYVITTVVEPIEGEFWTVSPDEQRLTFTKDRVTKFLNLEHGVGVVMPNEVTGFRVVEV
jgi:hypothetical protein